MTEDRQNAPCPVDHCGATIGGPCISRDGQIMSRVHPERGTVNRDPDTRPVGEMETRSRFEREFHGTAPPNRYPFVERHRHEPNIDDDLQRIDDLLDEEDETPPSEEEKAASRRIFERAFYKVHGRWPDESDMRH